MFLAGALEVKGEQETGCKDRKSIQPLVHTWSADTGPLRPERAAPLGVCPLSQLTEGVDDSSCSLLSGDVAVLCCCIGALLVSFVGAARCAVPTRRPSANE